jgi:hypothetical protein
VASDMGSGVIAAVGALVGVFIGGGLQIFQARSSHEAQQADLLRDTKRKVYTEYLRSISAGYAVAKSRSKSPSEEAEAELRSASASEEGKFRAATAGIVLLSGKEISDPAKEPTQLCLCTGK